MDWPTASAGDERPHQPTDDPLWNESHYLDFFSADGTLGGYVRIGTYPNLGVIWYWACLVGPDRRLVTVIDHTIPLPARAGSLEIRHDGLWADHNVETPLEHLSLGLEAFGLALDDPADVYRGAFGDRTPIAFDLEWETDGEVFRYPDVLPRYEVPCRVHGEILVGHEEIDFDGFGQRDHSWGPRDWWSTGWCWTAFRMDDGARFHGVTQLPPAGWAIGYDRTGPQEIVERFAVETTPGPEGIPTAARFTMNDRTFGVTPLAWSPQLLVAPDARESRFPRALARFVELGGPLDGRAGLGWFELNQPPGPGA